MSASYRVQLLAFGPRMGRALALSLKLPVNFRRWLLGALLSSSLAPQAVQVAQANQVNPASQLEQVNPVGEFAQPKTRHPAPPGCATAAPVNWQPVAPGVWVWLPERVAEISPANLGRVLPISAVVDGPQALVIDPGPSRAVGWRVRRSLACQLGAQVRWVINTHAHAESVLGNSAFADVRARRGMAIAASAATRDAMQRRCPQCLQSLIDHVGAQAMKGSRIVLPSRTLREGDTLQIGRIQLQVMLTENAHTESDLLLWAPQQRVLWAGGLIYEGRVPELAQGSLSGWLNALPRLAALRPAVIVGAALSVAKEGLSEPAALKATTGYLQALRQRVLQVMDDGLDGSDLHSLELPDYADWVGYRQRHGFNVQRAWRELEPQWMETARPTINPIIPASPTSPTSPISPISAVNSVSGPASASVPNIGR